MVRLLAGSLLLLQVPLVLAADWPQWRGPERTGISKEKGLLQQWPADGPALTWKATDLGTGYSTPSVVGGMVYLQTTRAADESTLALDEKTGKVIWETAFGKVGKNQGPQYPGTRATPTVDGDFVYCLASDGELACLERVSGKIKWQKNLAKDLAGKVGAWAYTESVLIDGERLLCTPGGEAGLVALNKTTGEVIWKSSFPDGDLADYASIMPMEVGGKKQYIQFLRKGAAGVDAATGKFLWRYSKANDQGANILTPVIEKDLVFIAGSRTGGALLKLSPDGDGVKATEVYFDKNVAPSIGGAVLIDGHLYGASGQTLFCAEFATGKVKWKDRSVGASSVCYADGMIYARGHQSGEMALVEATPEGYREKGRFKQPERSRVQAWPHPIVANGHLYLRDQGTLLCYDVRATPGK